MEYNMTPHKHDPIYISGKWLWEPVLSAIVGLIALAAWALVLYMLVPF